MMIFTKHEEFWDGSKPYETNKWRSNYLDVVGIGQAPNWITNNFMS